MTDISPEYSEWPYDIKMQPDNKLLVSGYQNNPGYLKIFLVRYQSNYDPEVPVDSLSNYLKWYPNPASGHFFLEYALAGNSSVSLEAFDVIGQHLGNILDLKNQPKGFYKEQIDLSAFPSGIYLFKLTTRDQKEWLRVVNISK